MPCSATSAGHNSLHFVADGSVAWVGIVSTAPAPARLGRSPPELLAFFQKARVQSRRSPRSLANAAYADPPPPLKVLHRGRSPRMSPLPTHHYTNIQKGARRFAALLDLALDELPGVFLRICGLHAFPQNSLRYKEGFACRHPHIGLNADAFPVRMGNWIYGTCERHIDHEMLVNWPSTYRMRAAARDLAHDSRALECLEVVCKFLSSRKSTGRGEKVVHRSLRWVGRSKR